MRQEYDFSKGKRGPFVMSKGKTTETIALSGQLGGSVGQISSKCPV